MRRRETHDRRALRAGMCLSASSAVLAMMLAAQPARAQAFLGTQTAVLGTVDRIVSGNTEVLVLTANQTTINWLPTDTGPGPAPINFMPAGGTATFALPAANGPWTVLNRIIAADPTRAIQLAGAVNAEAFGRVWFYAPGGLLIGSTAQFNVGGLLLTANDPVGAAAGNPFIDATGSFRLAAAANSTARVNIAAGATITSDSYMIAVAPRFAMNGAATVGTSAALVAAEDVSFTLNGGLFDITANVGSAAGGTSEVRGSITGAGGSSAVGVFSRIYMMAVPRNDAITLLITGGAQLGFDVANAVDIDGNAIILSGGYNIVGSTIGEGTGSFGATPVAGSVGAATISLDNAGFSSTVIARSRDVAQAQTATGNLGFARNLELYADGQAVARGLAGNTLLVGGRLLADASAQATGLNGGNRTAGLAEISASGGGTVQVLDDVVARANARGDDSFSPMTPGGTGTGGSATIGMFGGSIRATSAFAEATGTGGFAEAGRGGSGVGGQALVQLDADGTLALSQGIFVSAAGFGSLGQSGQLSGNARGGTARFQMAGALNLPGQIDVRADAGYNEASATAHLGGGEVRGGIASVSLAPGAALTGFGMSISAVASGDGASGNNRFFGGTAGLTINTASLTLPGGLTVDASARGSSGNATGNVDGGDATGGFAGVLGQGNVFLSLGGDATVITADALGGTGNGGVGGAALGGRAHLDLQGGGTLLQSSNLVLSATATGGSGTTGGDAAAFDNGNMQPPAVLLRLGPGSTASDQGIQVTGLVSLAASATGGNRAPAIGGSGAGGLGAGGSITIDSAGIMRLGDGSAALTATASGTGGDGLADAGGAGIGGTVLVQVVGAGSQLQAATPVLDASGTAGTGSSGGAAQGGSITAVAGTGGTLTLTDSLVVAVQATGGAGLAGGGGAATGGSMLLGSTGNGGTIVLGAVTARADALGGSGGPAAGNGGMAAGGSVDIGLGRAVSAAVPGSFTMASATVDASARGGGAGDAAAGNGAATGGSIRLIVNGGTGTIAGNVGLRSDAAAGAAPGADATAIGGRIEVGAADAGDGSAPGNVTLGGNVDLNLLTSPGSSTGPYTPGVLQLFASGTGSRLALPADFSAFNSSSGSAAPGAAERSGIVAGVGARIDFGGTVQFVSRGDIGLNDGGTITAAGDMSISSAGQVVAGFATPTPGATGVIAAPNLEIAAIQGINLVTNTTGSGDVLLSSAAGSVRLLDIDATRDLGITGVNGVTFNSLRADRNLGLFSTTAITGGRASAGGRLQLISDGSITTGALDSGRVDPAAGVLASLFVRALGPVSVGNIASARDAGIVAQGALTTGAISTARHAVLLTGGNLATGAVTTGQTGQLYVGEFSQRSLILFGADVPPDYAALLAAAPARLPGSISIGGDLATGSLQLAATGAILVGGTITASSVSLDSGASISLGDGEVDDTLIIRSDGAVTLGTATAGGAIRIASGAAIATGGLDAGTHVQLTSAGLITTGSITAPGSVILSGVTGVNSGAITAGNGIVLLDTGGITTGALTTSAQGFVHVSSNQQLPQIIFDQAGNPVFTALLAAVPQRLDGLIRIGGPVQTGRFIAAATGAFGAQAITAPAKLLIDAGGLASLSGSITAADIAIRSADIAIAADIAIGQADSRVRLVADSAATAMTVGGAGASATGLYSLSNAEFGAIRAGNILIERPAGALRVEALTLPGTAPVGSGTDFTLGGPLGTGAAAGSLVPAGITLASSGVLRVSGAVAMAQAASASRLGLVSGTSIEVVRGVGSIRLGSDPENPAGTLTLAAPQVRVATAALLTQIAEGGLAGDARVAALNAAQAGSDTAGSIGAGSIRISAAGDVLIQNSGGPAQRAGFTAGSGGLTVTRTGSGLVDLVINGRVLVAGIGFAVNAATIDDVAFVPGTAGFTATSTVNGCVLDRACGIPEALLQPIITVLTSVQPLTLDVRQQREKLSQPADRMPIAVLQRLFDFGPMFADVDATDPVTSGGNPALWLGLEPAGSGPGEQK